MNKKDWDITNRPHTQNKLEIINAIFKTWLTIWCAPGRQSWISNEWYIMDLFAGTGVYYNNNKEVDGSAIILLNNIWIKKNLLIKNNIKIKLFLTEITKQNFEYLEGRVKKFLEEHDELKQIVEVISYQTDCNIAIDEIISKHIKNNIKNPLFVLIDPCGLQIKKETIKKIVDLNNRKDLLLNYIIEGVRRVGGVFKKGESGTILNEKEIKTIATLKEFFGEDLNAIDKDDRKGLEAYVKTLVEKELTVVRYDMPYPDKKGVLYYLLFASKKPKVTDVIRDIYCRQKKKSNPQEGLFGESYEKDSMFKISPKSKILPIERKSLLYKTKVEYGDWTINHIVGCSHGCQFPCYAMRMAQRFGWVKNYEEWIKPKLVINALELLDKEIPLYKDKINFVHLCFMSDPFMYDHKTKTLIPEIESMTIKIIEKLNKEGIKVTTLTKGLYPDSIINNKNLLSTNEYGITFVSLNNKFKSNFEPFSSPYKERVQSLRNLANAGLNTWVSMEPYPIPQYDQDAGDIDKLLEEIKFVKKIVFGKLNYHKLTMEKVSDSNPWSNSNEFYSAMARKVIDFCKKNKIKYHIKTGTPLSEERCEDIFE